MLQTISSNLSYRSVEPEGSDHKQNVDIRYYFNIISRRFFYFLGVFALISILGWAWAAVQKPTYLSEGKVLVQSQEVAPDIAASPTASERTQLIQHRIVTRDHLLSIASSFRLFPRVADGTDILELMRKRIQIKPISVEVDGQLRPNSRAAAFTVGFEYEDPKLAMRVANELITLIVSGDERSQSNRTTDMVKLLEGQTKDIEAKLESTQTQMIGIARSQRELAHEMPEEQKSQLTALAALKAELVQKASIYSDAHPVVSALKKRIAAMEKLMSLTPPQSHLKVDDDMEALRVQREALEKQLADASSKLSNARLREKLDFEQHERMQVIEAPSLPEKPVKSKKIVLVGMAFVIAVVAGLSAAIGPELLRGTIAGRTDLAAVVPSSLVVCIPYIKTHEDIVRRRVRISIAVFSMIALIAGWVALIAAILYHVPIDFFR